MDSKFTRFSHHEAIYCLEDNISKATQSCGHHNCAQVRLLKDVHLLMSDVVLYAGELA